MAWIEIHRPDDEHPEFRDMLRELSHDLPEEYLKAPSTRLPPEGAAGEHCGAPTRCFPAPRSTSWPGTPPSWGRTCR